MKQRIFLTGGSSFIGRNLIQSLSEEYIVDAPEHNRLDITVRGSVAEYIQKGKFNFVIHAAFIGGNREMKYSADSVEQNIRMFTNIVSNEKHYDKCIYFCSGAVYDKSRPLIEVSEEAYGVFIPQDSYGLSKYICAVLAERFSQALILRPFGVYGPGEDIKTRFISYAINCAINKKPIMISQNVFFDYMHVEDLICSVKYFLQHNSQYSVYNVGSGQRVDLLSIAEKVKNITGSDVPVQVQKKGLQNEYTCSINRLKHEMTEFAPRNIEEGIRLLYEYYISNAHITT